MFILTSGREGPSEGNKWHFTEQTLYVRCFQFCIAEGLRNDHRTQEQGILFVEKFQILILQSSYFWMKMRVQNEYTKLGKRFLVLMLEES